MQPLMLKLDRFLRRHRRAVLAAWAVAFLAALPFAARQAENLTGGGFAVPGSQSDDVQRSLERDFDATQRAKLGVVLIAREGATAADRQAAIDVAGDLREELGIGTPRGSEGAVTTHLIGQGALWAGLQEVSKEDLATAESVGFPIVALILLVVFGSLAAAALPLALGAVSVLVTGALIYFLSRSMEMSIFTTNMASMIGIGVAVDYSLFVLARYREEVAAGRAPDEARGVALATSGIAVLFSGLTVIASLAGLLLVDTTALRSMALGSILVVAVSVLTASTLLPALISLLGHRAHEPGRLLGHIAVARRARPSRRPPATPRCSPPRRAARARRPLRRRSSSGCATASRPRRRASG